MADIQDNLTKVHKTIRPLLEKVLDEETHLSFSSVGQDSNELYRQLEVLMFIFTLTTLMYHRDSGIQGSDMNGSLKKLHMDMKASALYSSVVPANIQENVAEVLGNASIPEEPPAKKLRTETIPTAFMPPGGVIAEAGEPPPKAPRRQGPGGRGGHGERRGRATL